MNFIVLVGLEFKKIHFCGEISELEHGATAS